MTYTSRGSKRFVVHFHTARRFQHRVLPAKLLAVLVPQRRLAVRDREHPALADHL